MSLAAAQPIQTGINDDAVQPAADCGVVPERTRTAMRREHCVLQRILGVLVIAAGQAGKAMQLAVMTVEQLGEGVAVAGDVIGQQFGVAALPPNRRFQTHGRTVTNRRVRSTSPQTGWFVDWS